MICRRQTRPPGRAESQAAEFTAMTSPRRRGFSDRRAVPRPGLVLTTNRCACSLSPFAVSGTSVESVTSPLVSPSQQCPSLTPVVPSLPCPVLLLLFACSALYKTLCRPVLLLV